MRAGTPTLALCAALGVAVCGRAAMATGLEYPQAPRADVVDNYHGVSIADPYRTLESLDSDSTRAWVQAQNALAEPWLAQRPQREWFKRRLAQITNYERRTPPIERGGHFFQLRNTGDQNQSVLYVANSATGRGRILLDPNTLTGDATISLAQFEPDPQGKLLAYAVSDGGSDWDTWHVRDVASGADLPDVLRDTKFTGVSWARDGSGFYYSRYPMRADGSGDDQRQPSIWFHRIRTAQQSDQQIFSVADHPTRVPYGTVTEDGHWLVINITEGTFANDVRLLALGSQGRPPDQVPDAAQVLFGGWDARYNLVGARGDELYFWTTSQAPRGRVIAVNPALPARSNWRDAIAEGDDALVQAALIDDRLIAVRLHDAYSQVSVYTPDGRRQNVVDLPGLGTVSGFDGECGDRATWFSYTGFTTPARLLRLIPKTGRVEALWRPRLPAVMDDFVTEQVFFASRDGTRIPMFIVRRRGMPRDGNQPVLLYGYGGFDISVTPGYSSATLAWLEMGGIYAVANLRGGGEYGRAWHEAGAVLNKQNVFDDFIAAAQFLIDQRYTSPRRLAISGRSNGGLLVGAALTQRPDLFGAALPAVGVLDMLRYHTASANARQWSADYGLAENDDEFQVLHGYSPLHRIRPGVCYPPTLVTSADHDDRVVPWHSYKFAATLQDAQAQTAAANPDCTAPILLRVETRAGHGAGKPLWMQIEDDADRMGFAAYAIGMTAPR